MILYRQSGCYGPWLRQGTASPSGDSLCSPSTRADSLRSSAPRENGPFEDRLSRFRSPRCPGGPPGFEDRSSFGLTTACSSGRCVEHYPPSRATRLLRCDSSVLDLSLGLPRVPPPCGGPPARGRAWGEAPPPPQNRSAITKCLATRSGFEGDGGSLSPKSAPRWVPREAWGRGAARGCDPAQKNRSAGGARFARGGG